MWNSIRNISSAVADLSIILAKEVSKQFDNVSEATEGVTITLATKAAELRAEYEKSLEVRCNSITTTTAEVVVVVTESEAPHNAVPVN